MKDIYKTIDVDPIVKITNIHDVKSDQANVMLSASLPWIIRWGIVILAIIMLSFFLVSHYIIIPDSLETEISIINNDGSITGIGYTTAKAYYEIKPGQEIDVYLYMYPVSEYGYIKGTITAKYDRVDVHSQYAFTFSVPQDLETTYGRKFSMTVNKNGKGYVQIRSIPLWNLLINKAKS